MSHPLCTEPHGALRPRSVGSRWLERAVLAAFEAVTEGQLAIEHGGTRHVFGTPAHGPSARVLVHDERFWRAVALRGALGGAEAYRAGWWSSDDLVAVIRVLARNARALDRLEKRAGFSRPALRLLHWLRDNHRRGSRRNIAAHYDLGNEFFATFLDPTLTYSSAIFEPPGATLEEAQRAKYERICRKLGLDERHRVLEIGAGWGGFAIHAARTRGCRVTAATISRAQLALAQERVAAAGLSDRVELLDADYRDLDGSYDRVVSIEMIEAVGHRHLPRFFEVCSERLAPDGAMALQAILVHEQDWERSIRTVDFVKRYVFPGGQLVSLGAIAAALAERTDLRVTHYEDITPHYAETLRRWRERFLVARDSHRALGLSEEFLRTWDFYLAYCDGAFRERANAAAQIVMEKPGARLGELPAAPLESA